MNESFGEKPTPLIYLSYRDRPSPAGEIHLRTRAGAELLLGPQVERVVRDLDPTLPVYDIRTLSDHVEKNLVLRRIPARMFVVLGPALLILAAIGIYAVVAYAVSLRTKEIGLRLALGATNGRVVSQIVTESLRVVFVGGFVGWMAAFGFNSHLLRGPALPLGVRRRAGAAFRRRRAGLLAAGAARLGARSDRGAATGVTAARWIGLDFGTTNSAVALADASGPPRLALFPTAAGPRPTFPSVLYFEPRGGGTGRPAARAGPAAIERYLASEHKGRFIQSLKTYLADRTFEGTAIGPAHYTLEKLVAIIARQMGEALDFSSWPAPRRIVLGRPVHFSNPSDVELDRFAAERLLAAIRLAGFEEIVFEFEPIAAAYAYEARLDRDERILIGDFGGGTSDFTIISVGPGVRARGRQASDIIGTDGVAIAGDVFDKRIIRNLVAPRLGLGGEYLSPPHKFLPVPSWPYERLERWHYLSFLKSPQTLEMLERIQRTASTPERLQAFLLLIKHELGYQLHEAGTADQVRAVHRHGIGVHVRVGAGDHQQESDARRLRALDRGRAVGDRRLRRSADGCVRARLRRHRSRVPDGRVVVRAGGPADLLRSLRRREGDRRRGADVGGHGSRAARARAVASDQNLRQSELGVARRTSAALRAARPLTS